MTIYLIVKLKRTPPERSDIYHTVISAVIYEE